MKLYIYDHCPYCVKARMIFGYHNLSVDLITLLNDDEETPHKLIGKKMVPILDLGEGKYMPESLDIIKKIDKDFGGVDFTEEPELTTWLSEAREYLYLLCMPRWVKMPLKEFETQGAIDYFVRKKEKAIGSFSEHLKNSDNLKKQAKEHLKKLETQLPDKEGYFLGDSLSINDFHLFATLRSLTCVKGLEFPPKVWAYTNKQSKLSKVPLYTAQSIA